VYKEISLSNIRVNTVFQEDITMDKKDKIFLICSIINTVVDVYKAIFIKPVVESRWRF
jgi:hypothetical protein